jgi:hypothetical protein
MADWGDQPSPDEARYVVNLGPYDSTKTAGLQVRGHTPDGNRTSKLFSFSRFETFEDCMAAAIAWRNQNIVQPKTMSEDERMQWRTQVAANRSITEVTGLQFSVDKYRDTYYPVAAIKKQSGRQRTFSRFLTAHTIEEFAEEAGPVLRKLPYHRNKALRTVKREIRRGLRRAIRRVLIDNPKDLSQDALRVVRTISRKYDILH